MDQIKIRLEKRDFQEINKVGEGSYASVYSANKEEINFAIKIISLGQDEKQQQRVNREVNIMKHKKLPRDHIVSFFFDWLDSIDGVSYRCIQMELCSQSLNTIIENQRDIIKANASPRFYQIVFPQILEGLKAIHSIGWVHRDIHPGNILIVRPEKEIRDICVKIADFGNAREIDSIMNATGMPTVSAEPTFTLPFEAPEAHTRRYNKKIDLFCAGIVLCQISCYDYRAVSGPQPFIHSDDDVLIHLICLLIKGKPECRPSAEEALNYTWKESTKIISVTDLSSPTQPKAF